MQKAEKSLEQLAKTLDRYRKNKTLVSPEDLNGRYRVPFQKLQQQLKAELTEYVISYCYDGLKVFQSDRQKILQQIQEEIKSSGIEKKLGVAAFQNFDLQQIQQIAEEHKKQVRRIWCPYYLNHTVSEKALLYREENRNDE